MIESQHRKENIALETIDHKQRDERQKKVTINLEKEIKSRGLPKELQKILAQDGSH